MRHVALVFVLVIVAAGAAHADVGSVSPGKLTTAHASIESQCNRCHVPFGGMPATQCLACHTTLGDRLARGLGFHATVAGKPCADCHKEHRGRNAALTPAPPSTFDHRVAIFPLEGQHAQLACNRCHPAATGARQWVGIPSTCARCHGDRAHNGTLGSDCGKCHGADSWTPARRTLANHDVPMTGGHANLACASCHRGGQHLVGQQACDQCHRQTHGGTKRECQTCHSVAGWKQVTYTHQFPPSRLPGAHQTASCLSCHPSFRFKPTSFECASCHDKQRPHEPLGECSKCHSALTWKTNTFDHDRPEVGFALTGKHHDVTCDRCHTQKVTFKSETRRTCENCHANVHGTQFTGRTCSTCHDTAGWRPSLFDAADHATAGFPLRDAHARTACTSCHTSGRFAGTATACNACHQDTRHRGRFGTQCERCHTETLWSRVPTFDHKVTGFALERGHASVACARCHGADGKQLARSTAPTACATCHASPHGKQFGTNCTQCHSTASFRDVRRFDHSRTDFPLELRHSTLACASCHDPKQRPVANPACRTCHGDPHRGSNAFDCADCHRADRWRIIRFDHDLTSYPLTGRHRIAGCGGCHTNPNWTGVRTDCVACHALDRPRTSDHLTRVACDDCHGTTTWRRAALR